MWNMIDRCWAQEAWSASINPKGAFFCEIAAALSILFNDEDSKSYKVEPGWWWRIPKDYTEQMEQWCPRCGYPCSLPRRSSQEIIDDISPKNLDMLKGKSPKIEKGEYIISNLETIECTKPLAAYKDFDYRNRIANRYGIFLVINEQNFWSPYLRKEQTINSKSLYEILKERHS
jgi:hypothetical protein